MADPRMLPKGKGDAASRATKDVEHELANVDNDETKLPLHQDVMQLARVGELGPVQKLFENGTVGPDFKDEEGITPLHWAAINNHYALCKYLIDAGADVNAKGGEAVATPAMWAAQRCNYYVVHLLLKLGADPLLADAQGYNILHLATFDGNVFLLALLLQHEIPIDGPDPQGHTCLMWAAYKGYPACVDLFLRWGASVNFVDENGFTALHWAVVRGSQACIQKMIEYGSDRFAETSDKKTPAIISVEMKSAHVWYRALDACGYNHDGSIKNFPLPYGSFIKQPYFLNKFFFICPLFVILFILWLLSAMVIYAAVPLAVLFAYTFQYAAQQLLMFAPGDMRHLHKTPYLAGVFAATCFWVGVRWVLTILPKTFKNNPFLNVFFFISYSTCAYFYTLSMTEDPGFVPKTGSRSTQKAILDELVGLWKFDDQNFCIQCMARRPLRSKHCKRCNRCVAKHDHHCPWIHNCVGVNNLRHFFLYIMSMEVGIILFIRLALAHLENLPSPAQSQCNILAESICKIILRDTFTVVVSIWAALQLTWVTMLLFVQLVQISKATTTWEGMSGHIDYDSRASEAITAALAAGSSSLSGAQLTPGNMGPDPLLSGDSSHGHPHGHHHGGCFAQWRKLLGLDTFVATAKGSIDGSNRSRHQKNPFSRGVTTNCKDFFCDPAPYFGRREIGAAMLNGEVVNYARMYETPPRMKMRRSRASGEGAMYASVAGEEIV